MTLLAIRVLVVLGFLVGATDAEAVDHEAAGRESLVVAGLIMAVFLFYMGLSGPTMVLVRSWRRRRRTTRSASAAARTVSSKRPIRP